MRRSNSQRREGRHRSFRARHGDMAHAGTGLVREALGDHFVIRVERAVEEDQRGALQAPAKVGVDGGAARNVVEGRASGGVADFQADAVALARAEGGASTLEVQRHLARHRIWLDDQPACHLDGLAERQGDARYGLGAQHVEDAVGRQCVEHALRGVKGEDHALAQAQEAGHVIDIAVGQHHGGDRARAQAAIGARRQLRRGGELLAQVGRGVEQHPALPVPGSRPARTACARANPARPLRTSAQLRQLQLTCGNPPPAAEPSTLMIMALRGGQTPRSDVSFLTRGSRRGV